MTLTRNWDVVVIPSGIDVACVTSQSKTAGYLPRSGQPTGSIGGTSWSFVHYNSESAYRSDVIRYAEIKTEGVGTEGTTWETRDVQGLGRAHRVSMLLPDEARGPDDLLPCSSGPRHAAVVAVKGTLDPEKGTERPEPATTAASPRNIIRTMGRVRIDMQLTREQRYRHNAAAMMRCVVPTPRYLLTAANRLVADPARDDLAEAWRLSGLATL